MYGYLLSRLDVIVPIGMAGLFWIVGLWLLISTESPGHNRVYANVVLILSICVFIALSFAFFSFTIDDAYISLRYARNLSNGYGLVYSTDGSQPVEGYTNFLWVLLETPFFWMNISDNIILHSIKLIGIAFGAGIIITVFMLIHLLTRNQYIGSLGVLLLSAIPHLSFWAIGGLETTMYIFWMLIGLYFYIAEHQNGKIHIASMVFITLMSLTRPEGFFFAVAIIIFDCAMSLLNRNKIAPSRIRQIIPGIIVFAFLYCGYFLWRFNFYGFLLPNTFYAKSGTLGIGLTHRLVEMSPFIAYLLPLAAFGWPGSFQVNSVEKHEKRLLTAALILLFAFSFASKREWMPGFRYELPFLPILIIFVSLGIYKVIIDNAEKAALNRKARISRLGVFLCLGLYLFYPTLDLIKLRHYTDAMTRSHIKLGKWLKQFAPKESSYASWDMGAVPYFSELPLIIDIHPEGILSTHITHKGYDVNYFLSLTPSFIVLPPEPNSIRNICVNKIAPPESGMYSFYSNTEFRKNYGLLFSFALWKDYTIAVYKHHGIDIPPYALNEIIRSAEQSFLEVYPDST